MITAAQKYEKTSADSSNDGIEAYLSQKDIEKCDTKNTHPLLRLSYLLFRSSESYGTLQMLHGIRGVKTAVRCIFEEVSMHDMLKSGDSDGSLRFKAKSESEQIKVIREILYNGHKSYQYGLNECLEGAWVLKSIDPSDPEKSSVRVYDIHNAEIEFGDEEKITAGKVRDAIVSDITSKIEKFKIDFETAVADGNLVIAYQLGGDTEYVSAPGLQQRIQESYGSFEELNKAIESDRKAAIEKLRIRRMEKEAEKRKKQEAELESYFEYVEPVELEPQVEEVEPIGEELEKVA